MTDSIADATSRAGAAVVHYRCASVLWPTFLSFGMTAALLLGVGGLLGCGGDTTGPAPVTPEQAYWALQLNYRAVNMATVASFDTVRLTATPLNADGVPLVGLGPAIYLTLDSAVSVDSTGLVTAHSVTPQGGYARVIASLQDRTLNKTRWDTAFIQVTDTVPQHPLATISLQPTLGDSAKRALDYGSSGADGGFTWPAVATDVAGDTICNAQGCSLLVSYTSSNPLVARFIDHHTGQVDISEIGHTVFTASTYAYGVAARDSIAFTIGYRLSYTIPIGLSTPTERVTLGFGAPRKLVLGVNAMVTFQCEADFTPACDRPVDVMFDNPTPLDTGTFLFFGVIPVGPNGSGNIAAFGGDSATSLAALQADFRSRRFRAPGTYRYYSTLFPSDTFQIIIASDR